MNGGFSDDTDVSFSPYKKKPHVDIFPIHKLENNV